MHQLRGITSAEQGIYKGCWFALLGLMLITKRPRNKSGDYQRFLI